MDKLPKAKKSLLSKNRKPSRTACKTKLFQEQLRPKTRLDSALTHKTLHRKSLSSSNFEGQCLKLNPYSRPTTAEDAMNYLTLRKKGCSREQAIRFSSKQHCMHDSTKKYDGPSEHRCLKVVPNRKEGPNWGGWQLHPLKFKNGHNYKKQENLDEIAYEYSQKVFQDFLDNYDLTQGFAQKKPEQVQKLLQLNVRNKPSFEMFTNYRISTSPIGFVGKALPKTPLTAATRTSY